MLWKIMLRNIVRYSKILRNFAISKNSIMNHLKLFVLSSAALLFLAFGCKKEESAPESNPAPLEPYCEQCIFRPGDYGSTNWRIPAVLVLQDGSILIASDKRKYNQTDLPEDIDIVVRRSTDLGVTWTEPHTIAQGTGYKHGFGDCTLVQCEDGTVVAGYVGGNGLWASTESDPIRSYIQTSNDGGLTWNEPVDITSQLWGSQSQNSTQRLYKASFFASGNGVRLTRGEHKGRIIFVAAMVKKANNQLDNFAVYSDDNGATWTVSKRAYSSGDESKVIELNDGRVLMSVRQNGARGYTISSDGGETWGTPGRWNEMTTNACNGDMLRVFATDKGDAENLILHSIPNSMNREKVSLYMSRDEGQSWQFAKELCPEGSCYSSLSMLPDGRIVCYVERDTDGDGNYELWFLRFTLGWLMGK